MWGLLHPARRFVTELEVFPFMVLVRGLVAADEHQWLTWGLNWRLFPKFLITVEVRAFFFVSKFKELLFNLMFARIIACKCTQIMSMCVFMLCALLCQNEVSEQRARPPVRSAWNKSNLRNSGFCHLSSDCCLIKHQLSFYSLNWLPNLFSWSPRTVLGSVGPVTCLTKRCFTDRAPVVWQ